MIHESIQRTTAVSIVIGGGKVESLGSETLHQRAATARYGYMSQVAKLALEDGTVFAGEAFGKHGEVDGEVCFNTSMTGYQEIITDPSYRGQIVTMTYPQIGNYGVNQEDIEREQAHLSGFVVRECSRIASNFRSDGELNRYLSDQGVVGISGIDTRSLVRRLRVHGVMKGVLSSIDLDNDRLVAKAKASPGLVGRDLVREVVPPSSTEWSQSLSQWAHINPRHEPTVDKKEEFRVVALDFGMKWNIARHLHAVGAHVTVLPGTATSDQVAALRPDGIFLSNGPGDPEPLDYAINTIKELLPSYPLFGICLGHQLMALAGGAKTFKLRFGHRGANQPVLNCITGKVEITAQNHGFAVDEESLPEHLEITHRNLNDNTIAGLRHRQLSAFSVQYHPEASSGPHDSRYLFDQFRRAVTTTNGS